MEWKGEGEGGGCVAWPGLACRVGWGCRGGTDGRDGGRRRVERGWERGVLCPVRPRRSQRGPKRRKIAGPRRPDEKSAKTHTHIYIAVEGPARCGGQKRKPAGPSETYTHTQHRQNRYIGRAFSSDRKKENTGVSRSPSPFLHWNERFPRPKSPWFNHRIHGEEIETGRRRRRRSKPFGSSWLTLRGEFWGGQKTRCSKSLSVKFGWKSLEFTWASFSLNFVKMPSSEWYFLRWVRRLFGLRSSHRQSQYRQTTPPPPSKPSEIGSFNEILGSSKICVSESRTQLGHWKRLTFIFEVSEELPYWVRLFPSCISHPRGIRRHHNSWKDNYLSKFSTQFLRFDSEPSCWPSGWIICCWRTICWWIFEMNELMSFSEAF